MGLDFVVIFMTDVSYPDRGILDEIVEITPNSGLCIRTRRNGFGGWVESDIPSPSQRSG
jgi:hypothetical protein